MDRNEIKRNSLFTLMIHRFFLLLGTPAVKKSKSFVKIVRWIHENVNFFSQICGFEQCDDKKR